MSANRLQGRKVLLGVSGGIAVYKAVEVLRGLVKAGANVSVVMTEAATKFVTPLTFQTLSNRPVGVQLFDLDRENSINHISLAGGAELALVAPCTANFAAKLRMGLADDLLSAVLLATQARIVLAPAMNDRMYSHPATQENLTILAGRGVQIIPPDTGFLAEGHHAMGRLADPAGIVARCVDILSPGENAATPMPPVVPPAYSLKGKNILITAGPTVEAIDPVRFLSNHSTGKMGYALAESARDAGARVVLVSGPSNLPDLPGVTMERVTSAEEMHRCVKSHQSDQHALILAAAVSDYRAVTPSTHKMKREGQQTIKLELVANLDISSDIGASKSHDQVLVVFAAESQNLIQNARQKLSKKNADLIVANNITAQDAGFGSENNRVTLLHRNDAEPKELPLMSKYKVATEILREVSILLEKS